tara:strand:- start:3011 stop:3979 length:969 start_codon:yes stop_codon:yes gene_type:complete
MKIHIIMDFQSGPWGGGNQFLKALRENLKKKNIYTDDPEKSDIAIFNSHHALKRAVKYKIKFPEKYLIHRVDGPMSYRGKPGEKLDSKIFNINSKISDGTIFQSEWSKKENIKQGMNIDSPDIVIHNAPDPNIFFPSKQNLTKINKKIKLISTSWSNSQNKGFDIYHYIDNNLDFDKYEMTFIGRVDKPFKNILTLDPIPSGMLSKKLRDHDIFIFASKTEACSNSLLEGIHSGLPCVVRNTSSNPEVLKNNGEVFNNEIEALKKIQIISNKLSYYKRNIKIESLDSITDKLINFCQIILYSKSFNKKPTLRLIDRIKLGRM